MRHRSDDDQHVTKKDTATIDGVRACPHSEQGRIRHRPASLGGGTEQHSGEGSIPYELFVAAAALLIICAIAPGAPAATPSGDYTQEQATSGSRVYNEYCVSCHGSSFLPGAIVQTGKTASFETTPRQKELHPNNRQIGTLGKRPAPAYKKAGAGLILPTNLARGGWNEKTLAALH